MISKLHSAVFSLRRPKIPVYPGQCLLSQSNYKKHYSSLSKVSSWLCWWMIWTLCLHSKPTIQLFLECTIFIHDSISFFVLFLLPFISLLPWKKMCPVLRTQFFFTVSGMCPIPPATGEGFDPLLCAPHTPCLLLFNSNFSSSWKSLPACEFLMFGLYLNYLWISTAPTMLQGPRQMFINYLLNNWINEIMKLEKSSCLQKLWWK